MPKKRNLQVIWPKDGDNGRSKRGFWRGLSDICTGKGPDMFLQASGSRAAIKPDRWGNWDSYHLATAHLEENYGKSLAQRAFSRYDPHSRTYVTWSQPHDWPQDGVNQHGRGIYPCFTEEEMMQMYSRVSSGRMPNEKLMGDEWSTLGPKRWRPEHQWFWSNAHRTGQNIAESRNITEPYRPYSFGITSQSDLVNALRYEFF